MVILICDNCGNKSEAIMDYDEDDEECIEHQGYCDACGSYMNGRLCLDCNHINRVTAQVCRSCGKADLLTKGTTIKTKHPLKIGKIILRLFSIIGCLLLVGGIFILWAEGLLLTVLAWIAGIAIVIGILNHFGSEAEKKE
jgi:ribosomal protein L40E